MRRTAWFRTPRALLALAAAAAGALAAGCNIVGPVAVALSPPPSNEAEIELPDRPTVVFVDDRKNVLNDRGLRIVIGNEISTILMEQEVLTQTISTSSVLRILGEERHGELMSIAEIGRQVDAEQVIYVELMSFSVARSAEGFRALSQVQVKVIDAVNNVRLYPTGDEGSEARTLLVELPRDQALQPLLTRSTAREAEETLAMRIADKVSKLFYKHLVRPLGSRITDR